MTEEWERLRECAALAGLLARYGRLSEPDREAWHPRQNEWEGLEPRELPKLHGELIAFGWLDLAIARSKGEPGSKSAGGYRVTSEGRRALREVEIELTAPAEDLSDQPGSIQENKPRRRKGPPRPAVEVPIDEPNSEPSVAA